MANKTNGNGNGESESKKSFITHVIAKTHLISTAPYQQGKVVQSKKIENETDEEYERRTWKERCHVTLLNGTKHIIIPPVCFKKSITIAASLIGERIKGKGMMKWNKQFESGVLVPQPVVLPDTLETIKGEELFLPSRGIKGGGTRVFKIMPTIPQWEGTVTWVILSPNIDEQTFKKYVEYAGAMVGVGVYRIGRGGYYGSWKLLDMEWANASVI